MANNNLEARFQAECYAWFCHTYPTERPYLWMNYNNPQGAFQGAQLKSMGLLAGISDMTYLAEDNFPYFFELKVSYKKQSPAQLTFEKNIKERGGVYAIIRSLDEFKFWANVGITHVAHRQGVIPIAYAEFMGIPMQHLEAINRFLYRNQPVPEDTKKYFTNIVLCLQ